MGDLTDRKRRFPRRATAALLLAALAVAPACSTFVSRPDAIHSAAAHDDLNCAPLAIDILAELGRGTGSGVLVHPQVLLTARHVLPDGPDTLVVYPPPTVRGEPATDQRPRVALIRRVVDGGGQPADGGDWALLVLAQSFETLGVMPATLPAQAPELRPGAAVSIAGWPMADEDGDEWGRRPLLIHTVCIKRPAGAPLDPAVVFARNSRGQVSYNGASGGPVLTTSPDGPVLAGVYLGTAERSLAGALVDREILIHPLPLDAIRRVIAEVESGVMGSAPAAGQR